MILRARIVPILGVAAFFGGCRGCRNDHPYVPPVVEAGAGAAADAAAAAPVARVSDAGGAPAIVAPPAVTAWTVGGLGLEAGGREIVMALVDDLDGDGVKDALAIVRPAAAERQAGASTGELVWFHGGEQPLRAAAVAAGPALGVHPSCAASARLERLGPRAAFAEIGSACPRGDGERAVFVVRLGAGAPSTSFDAVVVDPAQAPALALDADVADRDKDGIDDVILKVGLGGASAKLAFFDRPAGPSRDPEEPDASLRAIAAQAASRAGKAKDAPGVPALAQQARALYRAMCLEGGAPRVGKIHGGSAASCGASRPLEDLGAAEVRAWVTQGDALRAFAAAEQAQGAPATKTPSRAAEIAKALAEVAPPVGAAVRVLGAAVDAPQAAHPEWGPLAFEAGGKLLVRRGGAVSRVDPESGEAQPSEVPAWKAEVLSPDGKARWLEAYHACEGVALRATFAPTGDGDMTDVPLPITPRLGTRCGGGRGEPAPAVPISWGARGLEALVLGQPVLVNGEAATSPPALLDEAPPPGSPRSPGGRAFALATATGILLKGRPDGRWVSVRNPEIEPYAELKRCVPSDDASRIACVRRGKVVVITAP